MDVTGGAITRQNGDLVNTSEPKAEFPRCQIKLLAKYDVRSANVLNGLHLQPQSDRVSVVEPIDQKQFYARAGASVRSARGKKMTQEELANATGLSRVSVVNIEAGRQKLLLHHVFAFAKALGLTPAELLAPLYPASPSGPDLSLAGDAKEFVQAALKNLTEGKPQAKP